MDSRLFVLFVGLLGFSCSAIHGSDADDVELSRSQPPGKRSGPPSGSLAFELSPQAEHGTFQPFGAIINVFHRAGAEDSVELAFGAGSSGKGLNFSKQLKVAQGPIVWVGDYTLSESDRSATMAWDRDGVVAIATAGVVTIQSLEKGEITGSLDVVLQLDGEATPTELKATFRGAVEFICNVELDAAATAETGVGATSNSGPTYTEVPPTHPACAAYL